MSNQKAGAAPVVSQVHENRRRSAAAPGRRARRMRREQRGAAIVEFALVLPLLLLIVFGIVEFGFILYDKTAITSASRAAVRQGVAFGEDATGSPVYLSSDSVKSIAKGNLSTMLINFSTSTTQPSVAVSNCTPSGSCTPDTGCTSGNSLTVAVSYTFTGLALGASFNPLPTALKNALTLTSSTMMSCE